MRTNLKINQTLIEEAQKLSGISNNEKLVECALENFIHSLKRKKMLELRGNVEWEGDLKKMRKS
jgi:Arc/MetJ family transcription regulator